MASSTQDLGAKLLIVGYDYEYDYKTRKVSVRTGEVLHLLQKTNEHWWKVVRALEGSKPFFVPAQYVREIECKDGDNNIEANQNKEKSDKSKPNKFTPPNSKSLSDSSTPLLVRGKKEGSWSTGNTTTNSHETVLKSESSSFFSFSKTKPNKISRNEGSRSSHREKGQSSSKYNSNTSKISAKGGKLKNWSASLEELSKQIVFPGLACESVANLSCASRIKEKDGDDSTNNKFGSRDDWRNEIDDGVSYGREMSSFTSFHCDNNKQSRHSNKCLTFNNPTFNSPPSISSEEKLDFGDSNQDILQETGRSITMVNMESSAEARKLCGKVSDASIANDCQQLPATPLSSPVRFLGQEGWAEFYSPESKRYFYYNSQTNSSSWKPPRNTSNKKLDEHLGSSLSDGSANASSFEKSLENIPDLVGSPNLSLEAELSADKASNSLSDNDNISSTKMVVVKGGKSVSTRERSHSIESVTSVKEDEVLQPSLLIEDIPIPEGWDKMWDETAGQICYVNKLTGARKEMAGINRNRQLNRSTIAVLHDTAMRRSISESSLTNLPGVAQLIKSVVDTNQKDHIHGHPNSFCHLNLSQYELFLVESMEVDGIIERSVESTKGVKISSETFQFLEELFNYSGVNFKSGFSCKNQNSLMKSRSSSSSLDKQWFSSQDPQARVYYYEETSSTSSWFLPAPDSSETSPNQSSSTSKDCGVIREDGIIIGIETNKDSCARPNVGVQNRHSAGELLLGRSLKTKSLLIPNDLNLRKQEFDPKSGSLPRIKQSVWVNGKLPVLREGPIARAKITEHGKKLRKSWGVVYAVLTESHLSLFKDQKSFLALTTKTELEIELEGALLEWADEKSSRKNVFQLSTNTPSDLQMQMLFQVDDREVAEEWFDDIKLVTMKSESNLDISMRLRSTESPDLLDPPVGERKSSRLIRNKSTKLRITSVEDKEKLKIKDQLKKFFSRRMSKDALVKKGIYKDETVFGSSLQQLCNQDRRDVPKFVQECIVCIEEKEENLKTDGLYRASGNLSQVQKIRLQVDQNNMSCLVQEEDVHVLAGCLKLFFRELKEPLIPPELFEKALQACHAPSKRDKVSKLREIVSSLPKFSRSTLQALLRHLLKVASYSEFNRMQIPNLAIVFGPTLMYCAESQNMASDLMQQNLVIEAFLVEYEAIFQ